MTSGEKIYESNDFNKKVDFVIHTEIHKQILNVC